MSTCPHCTRNLYKPEDTHICILLHEECSKILCSVQYDVYGSLIGYPCGCPTTLLEFKHAMSSLTGVYMFARKFFEYAKVVGHLQRGMVLWDGVESRKG